MQPSQLEIQREVEALRDIRRRSTTQGGPGTLILDPDLPNPSSPTSPTSGYWSAGPTPPLTDGDSSSSSHEGSSSSEERSSGSDDPFHLFWVPASLHPEIAPAEFRAFLKEHARGPPPEGTTPPERSNSLSVPSPSALGRRRSMLSRQYKPSDDDNVEEEKIVPIRRNRSMLSNDGPQLTISDLQKLEELAEEASLSDDPSKLRTVLRRSLTMNVAPSVIDKMDDMPDMPDEADAPILPRPGQFLRRSARTKIRKPGLPGDGGGHRFPAGRRKPTRSATMEPRSSSDLSSSDHGHTDDLLGRPRAFSTDSLSSDGHTPTSGPDSYNEEAVIYDAYAQEEPDDDISPTPTVIVTLTPTLTLQPSLSQVLSSPRTSDDIVTEPSPIIASGPALHHPQPQRLTTSPPSIELSRTPSPDGSVVHSSTTTEETAVTSSEVPPLPSKSPSPVSKKDKDKRGLFKWGSDKSNKKNGKEREREKDVQRGEKEKESGFFGSLFSGKKKPEEQASASFNGSGRETAAALLGASKSSKAVSPSPSPSIPGTGGSYARYPIHVERAIYRLSHIKLANPRRPLYEQVLISNLMFWYLGVINKTQNLAQQQPGQGEAANAGSQPDPSPAENEKMERAQREAEERQRAEKERMDKEQAKKESPRRGSLTKNAGNGKRAAEMPIKAPQYEMQHRVMEQEYGSYGYGSSSPTSSGANSPRRQPSPSRNPPPALPPSSNYHNHNTPVDGGAGNVDSHLPPGAMPPAAEWGAHNPSPQISRSRSAGAPHVSGTEGQPQSSSQRSKSPPPVVNNRHLPAGSAANRQVGKAPIRSVSAVVTSTPSPVPHDARRKTTSAHAVVPRSNTRSRTLNVSSNNALGEEEDVPLAVVQQQRRR